jgi:hypothetical protein
MIPNQFSSTNLLHCKTRNLNTVIRTSSLPSQNNKWVNLAPNLRLPLQYLFKLAILSSYTNQSIPLPYFTVVKHQLQPQIHINFQPTPPPRPTSPLTSQNYSSRSRHSSEIGQTFSLSIRRADTNAGNLLLEAYISPHDTKCRHIREIRGHRYEWSRWDFRILNE